MGLCAGVGNLKRKVDPNGWICLVEKPEEETAFKRIADIRLEKGCPVEIDYPITGKMFNSREQVTTEDPERTQEQDYAKQPVDNKSSVKLDSIIEQLNSVTSLVRELMELVKDRKKILPN